MDQHLSASSIESDVDRVEHAKTGTRLANELAAAGAAYLAHMRTAGGIAAIPGTDPQQYVVAGTLAMIGQVLPQSPAPIPEQVAQAAPEITILERVPRYDLVYSGYIERDDEWLKGEWVKLDDLKEAVATQSAKQSNLQEENRQLRQRIEDLTTAANQCINDAIGQSAQEVTQQAAKADTSVCYQAALLAVERMRGCSATYIEDHAKDTYPGAIGLRPQDVATMWAQEIHGIDAKVYLDEAIADLAPTTSTVVASGAPAAADDVRNQVLEEAARACQKIAEERFWECGIREPDTGATYYSGRRAEELETRDEEDNECAEAIRKLKRAAAHAATDKRED